MHVYYDIKFIIGLKRIMFFHFAVKNVRNGCQVTNTVSVGLKAPTVGDFKGYFSHLTEVTFHYG